MRTVPITPATVATLRQHAERLRVGVSRKTKGGRFRADGWVFPRGRAYAPTHPGQLSAQHFHPLRRKAGLPDLRMYDLRHTCATHLVAAGVSLRVGGRPARARRPGGHPPVLRLRPAGPAGGGAHRDDRVLGVTR